MIEVEKKFQPTLEQLTIFLDGAEFIEEKENTDTYYDMPDLSYSIKGYKLRKRNKGYELKIQLGDFNDYTNAKYEEVTNDPEILEKLGFSKDSNLEQIIKEKMEILCAIHTKRREYKKGEFTVDVDETDFGYNMVEVELMVENESQIEEAEKKIADLGEVLGSTGKKLPGKIAECLRVTRPDVYKILYPDN